jgi:hypothetical protein
MYFQSTRRHISEYIFFSLWGESESTWYCDLCLACCPSLRREMMMMMIVEQLLECDLAGETEVLGENLPPYHFVHQKSHMT